MAWPDPPDEEVLKEMEEKFKEIRDQTIKCPHCDELIFRCDVEDLGYCPECEEEFDFGK